jgi:hypothetical protein
VGGLNDAGAYNTALGDLMRQSIGDENKALSEAMMGASESEQERKLKMALANVESSTSRYGADAGRDAASYGANASMYGADMDYRGLLAGLDVQREGNWWENQTNWQQLALQYLQLMMGISPDQILGGYQPPTGNQTVT